MRALRAMPLAMIRVLLALAAAPPRRRWRYADATAAILMPLLLRCCHTMPRLRRHFAACRLLMPIFFHDAATLRHDFITPFFIRYDGDVLCRHETSQLLSEHVYYAPCLFSRERYAVAPLIDNITD